MTKEFLNFTKSILLVIATLSLAQVASASEPLPWQTYFQPPATEIMEDIEKLYSFMEKIMIGIVLFVVSLLFYTCVRFESRRNPVPATFSNNPPIEIIWTIIPVIILCIIAIPSFKLLKKENEVPQAELTIKVIGHQWYWSYAYQDHGNFAFDSYMIDDKKLQPGQKRLLDVDNPVVIPQNTYVRFLITGADVIHSFTVPSFGFKVDAVPGRVNETYVKVPKTGMYYGQCSEICGVNHGYMPISVQVVSKEDFDKWVAAAQLKYKSS